MSLLLNNQYLLSSNGGYRKLVCFHVRNMYVLFILDVCNLFSVMSSVLTHLKYMLNFPFRVLG